MKLRPIETPEPEPLSLRLETYAAIIEAILAKSRYGINRTMATSLMRDLRNDAIEAAKLEDEAIQVLRAM